MKMMSHLRYGGALAALIAASAVAAQPPAPFPANTTAGTDASNGGGDDIVVTGTRAPGRSRLDSPSPIDVLSGAALRNQGTTELGAALSAVTPSLDLPRSAAVDGTDSVRPATLRGLSPDQTLVLINGVRAHTSALLNTNGSVGRGAAAVDLNTIPTVALDRIEVLRDGASAQYGSDAIAGVINLRLREARSGGGASVSWGEYVTDVDTARGSRKARDGQATTVSGWQGFALGQEGFLTLSGEYLDRNATSRGDYDPRKQPLIVRSRFGDPQVGQYSLYANAGLPIAGTSFSLYAFGGYQHRDSEGATTPRVAFGTNADANAAALSVLPGYADGFLPLIDIKSNDLTATGGARGDVAGFKVDLSLSYGRNQLTFHTRNSGNATYGAASPTDFYDGRITYDQLVGNLNVSREVPLGEGTLNIAAGGEYRREGYKITAGQPESYNRLAGSATNLTAGAQGFIGFQPSNAVDVHRDNVSAYVDVEAQPVRGLDIGLAGRAERYSDFGHTENGKISARYEIVHGLALRGTFSTGFRAPSLQQQYFTSTASVLLTGGGIAETGTFPATSSVSAALGGRALEPEKARNASVGAVARIGGFDLTVDAYRIHIRNQIVLSENLATSLILDPTLRPAGVTQARFFINGVSSTTKGIDVVGHYKAQTAGIGTFDLTAAANFNDIRITRVPALADLGLAGSVALFSRQRIVSFEQGTPRTKLIGTVDWAFDRLGATARLTHYGDVTQPSSNGFAEDDIHTGRKTTLDLEARYRLAKWLTAAVGANNVFDVYPDYVRVTSSRGTALNSTGLVGFPYYSPFGFNGRFLYGRLSVSW